MKKVLICLMLIATVLSSSMVSAAPFSDLRANHWAVDYILWAQRNGIINGYEDGTFKPDNTVKTGEFIKLAALVLWPHFKYEAPKDGSHWAMPYAEAIKHAALDGRTYDAERLERPITRGEAVQILSGVFKGVKISYNIKMDYDYTEKYIKQYKDEAEIANPDMRSAVNICTQYELINGFEDGTFRASNTLTRAQAAKLIYVVSTK